MQERVSFKESYGIMGTLGESLQANALQKNVQMETGEISKKLKRGKHTTRHSQVIPVGHDTYLMDTPGFSSLYVNDYEKEQIPGTFSSSVCISYKPLKQKCYG